MNLIRTFVRTPYGRKIYALSAQVRYRAFVPLAMLNIHLGRFIGSQYTTIWPKLGISWFEHEYDYLRGIENFHWYERVVFANQVIKDDAVILDIGSGDGIFSGLFYSQRAKRVDGIDLDPAAIEVSKEKYKNPKVHFYLMDALKNKFPAKKYDNIFCFVVIEHFSEKDGHLFLKKVGSYLEKDGVFMGSTPVFNEVGGHNHEHQNEFTSLKKLEKFLSAHFKDVKIYTSKWSDNRLECYFECRFPKKYG